MPSSGYTAITFVANEQPTTAKWNLIGSNDSAFNLGTGLEDSVILNRHIAAGVLARNKIDWSTFALNIKSATNPSSISPANADNNFNANGAGVTFTVSGACKAFVHVAIGASSTTDFEFQPTIYLNGTLTAKLQPSAAAGNASNRATVRGFSALISLPSGANTLSAGTTFASGTGLAVPPTAAYIAAIVFGDVTA